jgi:hypothetical protein
MCYSIRDGNTEQVIHIQLKRKYVDLGSIMIRKVPLQQSGVQFLPLSVFTPDLFARDFFAISSLMSGIKNESGVKLIHRVLLFHQ